MDREYLLHIIKVVITLLVVAALAVFLIFYVDVAQLRDKLWENYELRHDSGAVDSKNVVGSVTEENELVLLGRKLVPDVYTLCYENDSGILEEYAPIAGMEILQNHKDVVMDDFIPENCAPAEATVIGVYNTENERVGCIALDGLKKEYGEKLYTFGALSDVHIGYESSEEDFSKALNFLVQEQSAEFVCVAGDITGSCADYELQAYDKIVSECAGEKPVYSIRGNHDSPLYRGEDVTNVFETPLYYSFMRGEDVFIMLGNFDGRYDYLFTREEMQWLYETLEENKDRRCFIFQHVRPDETSGNAFGIYNFDIWGGSDEQAFESLVEYYPNVTIFHGHSHLKFALQAGADDANYEAEHGYRSVHIPSVTVPRGGDETGAESRVELFAESEGYVVDVYENGIMLKGRDFITDKYLPIAQYYIYTTIKECKSNSYKDDSCIVHPDSKGVALDWERGLKIDKGYAAPVEEKGYAASQQIMIEDGFNYRLCSEDTRWLSAAVCFYDINGQYFGHVDAWENAADEADKIPGMKEIQIPEGAKSMRIRLWYPPESTDIELSEKLSNLSLTKWEK